MQNELMLFTGKEGFKVRIIMRDGEPWLVAKDVCDILGHTNPTVALQMLDEDEKFILKMDNKTGGDPKLFLGSDKGGGARAINIVSESGLYTLIFRSNKPEAKAFRRWVTHEVLPAVRKTGRYIVPGRIRTKNEIEDAGHLFFMDCYREGGIKLYLKKRYPDKYDCIRCRDPAKLLTRQEKHWFEEAEAAAFLAKEGRL